MAVKTVEEKCWCSGPHFCTPCMLKWARDPSETRGYEGEVIERLCERLERYHKAFGALQRLKE